ncbi:MAG: FAD-dependent oxidoreductase, partial [Alphaproteobacteria bacterium]
MDMGKEPASSGVITAVPAVAEQVFDVVVVGGGGTGLAASIEARNQGRRVALLEKNPVLGGSTGRSIG